MAAPAGFRVPAEDEEGTFFRTGAAGNDQLLNAGGASSAAFIDDG